MSHGRSNPGSNEGNPPGSNEGDPVPGRNPGDHPRQNRVETRLIEDLVEEAAHLLATQAPISVFVHHNTLHALEHRPFDEAVRMGWDLLGGEPYLHYDELRASQLTGRIERRDLEEVIRREPWYQQGEDVQIGARFTRKELRLLMLENRMHEAAGPTLSWKLEERGAGRRFREGVLPARKRECIHLTAAWLRDLLDRSALEELGWALDPTVPRIDRGTTSPGDRPLSAMGHLDKLRVDPEPFVVRALWTQAVALVRNRQAGMPAHDTGTAWLARDVLLETDGVDIDDVIEPVLISFTAAFLDQGQAHWPMRRRVEGFFSAFLRLEGHMRWISPHLSGLRMKIQAVAREGLDGVEVIRQTMESYGFDGSAVKPYLWRSLLKYRGWAGLIRLFEKCPETAPHTRLPCRLVDFLAVQLLIESAAVEKLLATYHTGCQRLLDLVATHGPTIAGLRNLPPNPAYTVFQAIQLMGLSVPELEELPESARNQLVDEILGFDRLEQRRLLHAAYEHHYYDAVLNALATRSAEVPWEKENVDTIPTFQAVFCIDEREESIRRHLEEVAPSCETFGAAGFFGIAVDYQSIDDSQPVALCPVSVIPRHVVRELPLDEDAVQGTLRRRRAHILFQLLFQSYISSRTLVRGWIATVFFGVLSCFPLALQVFSPTAAQRVRKQLISWLLPHPLTKLTLESFSGDEATQGEGKQLGFTVEEMAGCVGGVLRAMGLTSRFAPVVALIGHGSTSLNNPHESAHDCGACNGRRGAANAMLFTRFANRPDVRVLLLEQGVSIPAGTWFLGGCHDTASEDIDWFDLNLVPPECQTHVATLRTAIDHARLRSAHERCRRFASIAQGITPERALLAVQARSQDLAEPRPEYGHSTNAFCLIGRRSLTRGLFLDRRAFLVSYDPSKDSEDALLMDLLRAVIPVCAGINLEYYFSRVDNQIYGCGTKLPHNVTGLVGVVNGYRGDLRTGLPWQMVETHEPIRILFVIETTPDRLKRVLDKNTITRNLVENKWIRIATWEPSSGAIHQFERGIFVPLDPRNERLPRAPTSRAWYEGECDFLPIASIAVDAPSSQGDDQLAC